MRAKLLLLCLTLCDPMDYSLPGLCPWNSLGKNTGVGCHALLQGIFLTESTSLTSPALTGVFLINSATWEAVIIYFFGRW